MTPDDRDLAKSLTLAAVAVICAVLSATLVITAGKALLAPSLPTSAAQAPALASTAG